MLRLDESTVDNGPAETNTLDVDLTSNLSASRNTSVGSFGEHALGSDSAAADSNFEAMPGKHTANWSIVN